MESTNRLDLLFLNHHNRFCNRNPNPLSWKSPLSTSWWQTFLIIPTIHVQIIGPYHQCVLLFCVSKGSMVKLCLERLYILFNRSPTKKMNRGLSSLSRWIYIFGYSFEYLEHKIDQTDHKVFELWFILNTQTS